MARQEAHMYPLSVHLWVQDLPRSIDFYTKALGFTVRRADPEDAPTYAALRHGNDEIMLSQLGAFADVWPLEQKAASRKPAGAGPFTMYKESADIERDCDRARAAGANVLEGVVDRPWGQKEFVVEDPDGFWWTFWQVTESSTEQ